MKNSKFRLSKIYHTPACMTHEDKQDLRDYVAWLERHLNGCHNIDKIKDEKNIDELIHSVPTTAS